MLRDTIIMTREEVAERITLPEVIRDIEVCFSTFERGEDILPPKYIVNVPGGIAACMFGYTKATDLITMKLGHERKGNLDRGLPSIIGVTALFETETGELLLIVESVLATYLRTAAAAAVATRHLARKDSRTVAVIGCGALGQQCVRAMALLQPWDNIYLFDVRAGAAERVRDALAGEVTSPMTPADVETACRQADVIVTATNSTEPIVQADWVRPGTHLSCMGSDLPEKIECEVELLQRARLYADFAEHCVVRGEVSQGVESGALAPDPFVGSLGQVINGTVAGRQSDGEITLFDGLGIGVQDTTVTASIYHQAVERGLGLRVRFA